MKKFQVGDVITSEDRGTARVKAIQSKFYVLMMLDGEVELGTYSAKHWVAEKHFRLLTKLEKALR